MHKRVPLMSSTSNGFLFKNCYDNFSILGNNLQGCSHRLRQWVSAYDKGKDLFMNSQTREGATMKKKTIVSVIFALLLLVSGMMYWKYSNDYTHVIKENWNISIPSDSNYSEVYRKDSGSSFNGDGIRYHVFTYENEEPIKKMFSWKIDQGETIYDGNYLDATNKWLDEINVLAISRPQHTDCVYWYKSHEDHSEIIILWNKKEKRLYIVESFM